MAAVSYRAHKASPRVLVVPRLAWPASADIHRMSNNSRSAVQLPTCRESQEAKAMKYAGA